MRVGLDDMLLPERHAVTKLNILSQTLYIHHDCQSLAVSNKPEEREFSFAVSK